MKLLFNASQKYVLIKDIGQEIDFDQINKEFELQNYNHNVNNKVSIEKNFFDKEYFKNTKDYLIRECESYLNATHNLTSLYSGLRMTNSWANITEPGQSHHEHVHPFSVVSGVIFLDNNPANLNLFIEAYVQEIPHFITNNKSFFSLGNALLDQKVDSESVNNLQHHLILFLSNNLHFVNTTSNTDKVRRSISFNTFWKGLTGVMQDELGSFKF